MNSQGSGALEIIVLSESEGFPVNVSRLLSGQSDIRVSALKIGNGRNRVQECLAALDRQPGAILLIDAVPQGEATVRLVAEIFSERPEPCLFVSGPATDARLILGAQRSGAAEYLPQPLDRTGLLEALSRHQMRLAPSSSTETKRRGQVLSFVGTKGGCGTTTVAANLAVTLARGGAETVLVDFHPAAGEIALLVNQKPQFALSDVVKNLHRLDKTLLDGMVLKHSSGLSILTANEEPGGASCVEPAHISRVLRFLREHYECVVVDAGNVCSTLAEQAVSRSDIVHVVTRLDLLSLHRAQWSLQRIKHWGVMKEQLRLVINRNARNPYITINEAEQVLDMKSSWTIPEDYRLAMDALNEGTPFVERDRNGLRASFDRYAAVLRPPIAKESANRRKFFGLLSLPGNKPRKPSGAAA